MKRDAAVKTKEELNALKEKAETENRQCRLLTDEEVEQVVGGVDFAASSEPDFEMPNCNCKHADDLSSLELRKHADDLSSPELLL